MNKTRVILALAAVTITVSIAGCLVAYLLPVPFCEDSPEKISELLDAMLKHHVNVTTSRDFTASNAVEEFRESCDSINELLSLKALHDHAELSKPSKYEEFESFKEKINGKHHSLDLMLSSGGNKNWRRVFRKWLQLKAIFVVNLAKMDEGFETVMKNCSNELKSSNYKNAIKLYNDLRGNSPSVYPITSIVTMAFSLTPSVETSVENILRYIAELDLVSAARGLQTLLYQLKKHGYLEKMILLKIDNSLSSLMRRNGTRKEMSHAVQYIADIKIRIASSVEATVDTIVNDLLFSANADKQKVARAFNTHGELIVSKSCNSSREDAVYRIIALFRQILQAKDRSQTSYPAFKSGVESLYKCIISNKGQKTLPVLVLSKLLGESISKTRRLGPTLSDIEFSLHKMLPGVFSNAGKMLQTRDYKSLVLLSKWEPNCYRSNLNNFLDEAYTGDHDSMWSVVNFPMCLPEEDKTATFKAMVQHPRYSRSIFILAIKDFIDSANLSSNSALKSASEKAVSSWAENLFEGYPSRHPDFMKEVHLFVKDNRTNVFFSANFIMNKFLDGKARFISGERDMFKFLEDLNQPDLTFQFLSALYWRVNETDITMRLTVAIPSALIKKLNALSESFMNDYSRLMNDLPSSVLTIVRQQPLCISSADDDKFMTSQPLHLGSFINVFISSDKVLGGECSVLGNLSASLLVRNGCLYRQTCCMMPSRYSPCWRLYDKDFRNNLFYLCDPHQYSITREPQGCAAFLKQSALCALSKEKNKKELRNAVWKIEPC